MAESWWQETLRERLPADADIVFGEDGGAVKATFGRWSIDSGRGCFWTDVRGPGIHDRIAVRGKTFQDQWNNVISVLDALGAPIQPGRPFDPFGKSCG